VGDKRVSIRTLPSGERVQHHPPDDRHPDGMLVLIPEGSALREKLDAQREEKRERHVAIHEGHQERVVTKVAAQQVKGLPSEKSPI
jgi:hypothetical protein